MPLDATSTGTKIVRMPISSIVYRQHLYPRHRHDPATVQDYAERTTTAPAIAVNQHNVLIDGRHRMLAALERYETRITAEVIHTRNDQHLLELSVQMNFDHGLPLSQDDKRRLAKLRYDPRLGKLKTQKESIAAWLRVHYDTVNTWLQNRDHEHRQTRNDSIRELAAQKQTHRDIADTLRCSVRHVHNVLHGPAKVRKPVSLPTGFQPEVYDIWNLTSNDHGIEHFGKTDPRILDNLIYRYAREPDDVVLDMFAGSGVSVDVCARWNNRRCLAYDRKPRPARGDDIERHDILTDGLLPRIADWSPISLVFLDPPYSGQAKGRYSHDATDLANVPVERFENVLAELINALGKKLSTGSAVVLMIRPTQWASGPDHRIRDHAYEIRRRVKLTWEREIVAPLGRNATTTMRWWAERERECLVISRKLLIWRV